jgi:hypothetical protein
MCNSKTLKIQRMFKIASEFQSFKSPLPHINGLLCISYIFKNYSLKYNKTKECKILFFGDDLKFWSFFNMKHGIFKVSTHFLKFIFTQ